MWPELSSTVLYPPPPQRAYRCDGYGDYIFMVSRLTPLKRADLLSARAGDRRRAGHSRRDRAVTGKSAIDSRRSPASSVSSIA